VVRVTVAVWRAQAHRRCRFVTPTGTLTTPRDCGRPLLLLARGTSRWSLRVRLHIPPGRYRAVVRAVDAAGNVEPVGRRSANVVRLRVR
jgi:hypothetical protein